MKWLKRIGLGLILILLLAILGFVVWAETPLGPAPEGLTALESDASVNVSQEDFITFQPLDVDAPSVGIIFYPGGRVDARSYAVLCRALAEQGFLVVLVPVRLNLAFFDINAAQPVFAAYTQIKHWVVAGHSLGGVAAALFVGDQPQVEGLIFLASYPADDSLKNGNLHVLSIYGSNDMAGEQKFLDTSVLNPANTQYVIIEGGNHAQFGDYGPQPGDNEATISRAEQQSQTVLAIVDFLASIFK